MIPSSSMAAAAEEAAILAAAQAQAKEEAEIGSRLPREVLNILRRLDHQQLTIDALQGNISKLTDMVEQIALAVNSSPSPPTSPLLVSSPHDHRLPDCSNHASEVFAEMPQPYGFDNLKRQTIFLADGTERSYFALPENYPLQRAIPEPVLDVYDVDTKGCTDKFVDVFASTLKQQPYEEESIECSISNNKIELPSLTDFEIGCEHEKALISESAIMCYLASGLGWTEVNATILFFLVVKCSTGKAKLQWDPGIALFSYRFSWLVSDKNRGETGKALVWLESQLFSALQYQLQTSNKFSVWDPGIVSLMNLMLDKTAMPTRVQISQTPFKLLNFNEQLVDLKHIWSQLMLQCTSWGTTQNAFLQVQYCCSPLYSELVKHLICYTSRFSSTTVCRYTATTLCMRLVLCSGNIAQEGRHEAVLYQVLQNQLPMSKISYIWDPGTKHNGLYVYMIQLVGSSAIHACYLPSALSPPTHIVAYGSSNSKSGELTSRCLIFHLQQINNRTSTISHGITSYAYTMDFINDQLEFIRQRGVNENYKTKSLLISSKILPVLASYVWDPGTVLLLSKSIWLLPVMEEKGTVQAVARDEMLNAVELENSKSVNDIAASQGIRIRRHCRPTASMEEIEEEMGAPRNILEKIIWDKEIEVAQGLARNPLKEVIESAGKAPPTRDFYGALAAAYKLNGVPALIAEVKKASPSRGVLRENFDPVEIAQAYEKHGAACLSILTDEKYFQGSFENLQKVRKAGVKCPLLCKEFVIDEWQIYYARSIGADAILLIAAVLNDADITYFLRICNELGLTALIEVHDEREMERVLKINGVQLIGINNRSLETFIVDTSNTKMLLEKHGDAIREKGILVVGESGLFNLDDVAYVQNAGVSAVLVGESLVKQEDPGRAIAGLFGKELLH